MFNAQLRVLGFGRFIFIIAFWAANRKIEINIFRRIQFHISSKTQGTLL